MDWITAAVLSRRIAVLVVLLVGSTVAAIYGLRTIRLDTDTDSLIGETQPFMGDYRAFKREFGDLEYLIVAVDSQPPGATSLRAAEAETAVRALVERLRAVPELREVHGFITPDEQWRLAPWSTQMSESDLRGLLLASDAFGPLLARRPAAEILHSAIERLESLLPGASSAPPPDRGSLERTGAAAILALQAIGAAAPLDDPGFALASPPPVRWLTIATPPNPIGRFLFVKLMPRKDYGTLEVIEAPLRRIREAIAEVQASVPDVEIGLTGKPVLQADEMATTNADMTMATIVGTLLVALLFMAVFRGVRRPLLAVACFLVGSALTYGAAALLVGRLNLLSLVFMLVLVGVGLDYGIHMVARYTEGLRHLARRGAIRHMMRTSVPSNATGALIAAGVFLLALPTPFQGLRELGLISGAGLLICVAVMALLLPVLLDLFDSGSAGRRSFISGTVPIDAAAFRPRHTVTILFALGVAAVAAVIVPSAIRFESNLLKLQADSISAVEWERRILAQNASETWFGVAIVDSIDAIPPLVAAARTEPAIGSVQSVLDMVSPPTPGRRALLDRLGEAARPPLGIDAAGGDSALPPIDAPLVRRAESSLRKVAALAALAAPAEADRMTSLASRLDALASSLDPARHDASMIAARRQAIDDALLRTARSIAQMGEGARGTLREALPAAVRDDFTSAGGRFAVQLHPAGDVWEFAPMEQFVAAMRRVDPRVTGVPITHFESMLLMERSFAIQGVLSAIFVILALFIDLRRLGETLACVLTLAVALAWTLLAMTAFGVSFNLANFFAIPITLGLGADGCIHVVHRAREGLGGGFGSTRRAVTVTALTTLIGFGGLLLAQHRGLRSLGEVMVISTTAMLFATILLLPALLRLLARRELRSRP